MTDEFTTREDQYRSEGRKGRFIAIGHAKYYPLDPRPEEIDTRLFARALSNKCRFGGNLDDFYSVAEHSAYVSYLVPEEDAFEGLMHDFTEAPLPDVPRPIKADLKEFDGIEHLNWLAVCRKYEMDPELPKSVKRADDAMLLLEANLFGFNTSDWGIKGAPANEADLPYKKVLCLPPKQAFEFFMERFLELYPKHIRRGWLR